MNCSITRSEGKIVKVDKQRGGESYLFNTIAKHPLIDNPLDVYKNIFSDELKDFSEDDIQLVNKVGDREFTLKNALRNTTVGQDIHVGFKVNDKFYPIVTTKRIADKQQFEGFIQESLANGLLAESKVRIGNDFLFQSSGEGLLKKVITSNFLAEDAKAYLGVAGVNQFYNTFKFEKTNDKVHDLTTSDGKTISLTIEEFNALSDADIINKFENPERLLAERQFAKMYPAKRDAALEEAMPQEIRTEEELTNMLLSFLNRLGVTVTSINNYAKNYALRNGVNVNAEALADIANKVVAFADGKENIENLTEEVAHFINEAMPQEEVENVLRNIDKSEEWKEYSEAYRQVYQNEYTDEELDEVVRREVLGKVVANALKNKFSTENKSEIQANFIEKAFDMLKTFFNRIINNLKPEYIRQLDKYLLDVENMLQAKDVDLTKFTNNKFRFYSISNSTSTANDKLRMATKQVADQLQRQQKDLRRANGGSRADKILLDRVDKELEGALQSYSIRSLISMVENSTRILKEAVKDSKKRGVDYVLSAEELVIFTNLDRSLRPAIDRIKAVIDENYLTSGKEWTDLSSTIGKLSSDISSLTALKELSTTQIVERLADEITVEQGLSTTQRDYILNWMVRAETDVNWVQATFGTLVNTQDAMLSLLGLVTGRMKGVADRRNQASLKEFQKTIADLGFDEKFISTFLKDGYIISEVDQKAFNDAKDKLFLEAYKKEVPQTALTDEEIIKRDNLDWDKDEENKTLELFTQLVDDAGLREKRMNSQYYTDYFQKFKDLDISQDTQRELAAINGDIQALKSKAVDSNGKLNITLLSAQDRQDLMQREQRRAQLKSYVSVSGELKKGLRFKRDIFGNVEKEDGKPIVEEDPNQTMSVEGKIALDINKLDKSFRDNPTNATTFNKGMVTEFLNDLENIQNLSKEEQIAFLELNSFIGFNNDFWESMKGGGGMIKALEDVMDSQNEAEIKAIIDTITTTNFKMRNIIRNHTKKNNPSEVNVDLMGNLSKDSVKILQETLELEYSKARKFLKDVEYSSDNSFGSSRANEAYTKALKDSDLFFEEDEPAATKVSFLKQQIRFARKHMTESNRKAVRDAYENTEKYLNGRRTSLPKSIVRTMEQLGYTDENDINDEEVFVKVMKTYTESKLLPYYKRFTTDSYENFREDLNNSNKSVFEVVSNLDNYQFLEITPNYSYFDGTLSNTNANFIKNSGYGFEQPNLTKFRNQEFFDRFGDVVRDKETGEYVSATKNQKEFELYKAVIKFRRNQLDVMNMSDGYNIYTTPQLRKQTIEKYATLLSGLSGQKLRDAFEDIFTYTEDEQVFGDKRFGTQGKVIPKKFVTKLKNQSDISTDLFTGLALTNIEAYLHQARVEHFGDVMAIQDKILTREYDGIDALSSKAYSMMDSAIDYHIYGIKEQYTYPVKTAVGEFDLFKSLNKLVAFFRLKSLGFSIIIPATAFMTGKSQQVIERIVGQYMSNRSYKLGMDKFRSLSPGVFKDLGSINPDSDLVIMMQNWGAVEIERSLNDSKYGFLRNAPKTSMLLYSAASFPIYGSGLFTTLFDIRVVNGKAVKFSDFKRIEKLKGQLSDKEIITEWAKYEDNAIYNYISVKDKQVVFDKQRLETELNKSGEELEKAIDKINADIRIQSKNLNVRLDSQLSHEDRTAAQRSALWQVILLFKGYLVAVTENRFRPYGFNPQTRMLEQGSYSNAWEFLGGIVKEWKSNGHDIIKAFKNQYNGNFDREKEELDRLNKIVNPSEDALKRIQELENKINDTIEKAELRKYSLKRIGVDIAFVNGLMLLSMGLRNLADDDDKKDLWLLQMANLIMYRTLGEVSASNVNIVDNYTDIIEKPVMMYSTMKDLSNVGEVINGDDEKKQNKFWKAVLPGLSSTQQMLDPKTAFESKVYFEEVEGDTYETTKNKILIPTYWMLMDEDK